MQEINQIAKRITMNLDNIQKIMQYVKEKCGITAVFQSLTNP